MSNIIVPFIDLQQRFLEEREELMNCVERVLEKGHLIMTPEVFEFEKKVVEYTGAKHCVTCGNGTDGLMLALWAHGIGKGDEVITTPVSFVASTGSIVHVGAKPVYVDVRDDQNINPALIEAKITTKTKAILPVHWGGRIADMNSIMAIAKKYNLKVIEDSAQSMGAYFHGKHGGTFGDAGTISMHPLKNLNALGDGGMMLTNSDEIANKVRLYRNHGLQDRNTCVIYGVNSRLDALNAEILKYRLTRLDGVIARRQANVALYQDRIKAKQIYIPPVSNNEKHSYVMFIVQAEDRDALRSHLYQQGIETLVYYGTPLHLQPAAKRYGYKQGDFPVAEQQCERVLALPHHQSLKSDQIELVANAINDFYGA